MAETPVSAAEVESSENNPSTVIESQEEESTLDSGNTAWMITAILLVLFMTLPGLALFYGGLVQSKNVLSELMHCFAIACLASLLWFAIGYSLSLSPGGLGEETSWLGGKVLSSQHLEVDSLNGDHPESVWILFQMTFAIITPALVSAFVERMKFSAVLVFSGLWLVLVYFPVCYWVWGGGWLAEAGVIDFAGGIIVPPPLVHQLATCMPMLGQLTWLSKRPKPPHNPGVVMIGASMLWVGWFGFNAGSAAAADESAGMAMLVTHLSAQPPVWSGCLSSGKKPESPDWLALDRNHFSHSHHHSCFWKRGSIGCNCHWSQCGLVCYYACGFIKDKLGVDDSLDVAAVHGVGGILGTLLVSYLGYSETFGGLGINLDSPKAQFAIQAQGCLAAIALSIVATFIIVKFINQFMGGIRVSDDDETKGLDQAEHGENGYSLN